MNRPASRTRRLWVMAAAAWLLPGVSAGAARAQGAPGAERQWIERSAALAAAAKRHARVADFRRDIDEHRERLREIVRSAGSHPSPSVLQLHRSMILINALLHAAAECHAGGRLVCPADLMRQLDEQIASGLALAKAR